MAASERADTRRPAGLRQTSRISKPLPAGPARTAARSIPAARPIRTPEQSDLDEEPKPWYRKPATLIGWALLCLILIALIIYGITQLMGDQQGSNQTPTSTTTTAPTTTTTTVESATTTTTPSPTTTAEAPPATTPQGQPPAQQPTHAPTRHFPHLPPLPSVITIPECRRRSPCRRTCRKAADR
ncbi:hypothetical protein NIIDMKKI_69430 [Mycobacterium kansasii]|uniref:Uncharacterized protein n=1 Tax=Mycobacterium kansasii TaxID=1768 RepID=A0A7G1ILP6_MYCKA|nr:hypothetical protein NIIDMKKI_69430 [Mycobacterium kansasii]